MVEEVFRASLLQHMDAGVTVAPDLASVGSGLASRLIVQAGGIRVRVIIEPSGTDIDADYASRVAEIAAVFGAFPDTSGVLIMAAMPELMGAVVDRDDVVTAIETPSGRSRPPRIRRPITEAVVACDQFFAEAIVVFDPFDYRATFHSGPINDMVDNDRVAAAAIEQVVTAGKRARVEAKRVAWSELGAAEASGLSALLDDATQSSLGETKYRRRLAELVDAA